MNDFYCVVLVYCIFWYNNLCLQSLSGKRPRVVATVCSQTPENSILRQIILLSWYYSVMKHHHTPSVVFLINRSMISYRVNEESREHPVQEMWQHAGRQVMSRFDHVYCSLTRSTCRGSLFSSPMPTMKCIN